MSKLKKPDEVALREEWMNGLVATDKPQPEIRPLIGVELRCRLVVGSVDDWETMNEVLESMRVHGSAEITDFQRLG